ncbi:hypothetical protein GGI07_004503 [Coemansia sp. Benny D115]|nr:hypothetical protein GGI07_004503 [Coemansia sp. Benny D115]
MSFLANAEVPDDLALPPDNDGYAELVRSLSLTPLADLRPHTKVSLIAVVTVNIAGMLRSSGTDPYISLRLTDPSHHPSAPLAFMVFFKPGQQLSHTFQQGDILCFDNANTTPFNNRISLVSHGLADCHIYPAGQPVDNAHPAVQFLRRWWTGQQNTGPLTSAPTSIYAHPLKISDKDNIMTVAPMPAHNTRYLKTMSQIHGNSFPDLFVELLHIELPERDPAGFIVKRRCYVTDYTCNPALEQPPEYAMASSLCGSLRNYVAICDIVCPQDINRLPDLTPGRFYKLRGARVDVTFSRGLVLKIEKDPRYPKTIIVLELQEGAPELDSLLQRKKLLLESRAPTMQPEPVTDSSVTPIAAILKSPMINARFHVKARIVSHYPANAHIALTPLSTSPAAPETLCRFMLQLMDDTRKMCLVFFHAESQAALAALLQLPTASFSFKSVQSRIQSLFDRVNHEIDLTVALVTIPDPSTRRLSKCLCATEIHTKL